MRVASIVLLLTSASGCGGATYVKESWDIDKYRESQLASEDGGVRVAFHPAARDEAELIGEVQACDTRGQPAQYNGQNAPTVREVGQPIMERVALAPAGTWWVRVSIDNGTDHIVRLDRTVVKLIDPAGNAHEALNKDEIIARLATSRPCSTTMSLAGRLQLVKVFSRNSELLPGSSYTAWLVFDPGTKGRIAGTWKTALYEVPVATDPAGNVVKTARFELPTVMRRYRDTWKSGGMFGSDTLVSHEEVR